LLPRGRVHQCLPDSSNPERNIRIQANRLSLKQKVQAASVALVLAMAGLAATVWVLMASETRHVHSISGYRLPQLLRIADVELNVTRPSLQVRHAMLTPLASALTALVVGLVLAKVMRVGVNALAIAIRHAQVQIRHGRLASHSSEADRADAAVMRACYRSAVHAWPMPPRAVWRARCWAGTTPWLLYLIVLFVALLSLRLFGATTLEDVIGCAVTGVVLLATLVYAVREGVAAEGLTEPIADMRRVCARFESSRAFCEYLASEHRAVQIRLEQATFWCTNFFAEQEFGDDRFGVDFATAWRRRIHDADPRERFAQEAARPAIQWENA